MTLNDWMGLQNCSFMNVNVHSSILNNNFVNFSLTGVIKSMSSRTRLDWLKSRQSTLELLLKDEIQTLRVRYTSQ